MSFTELKDKGPMGRLHGHQVVKESRWTGGPNFTTSSSLRRKEATSSPWPSNFGLQTIAKPTPTSSTTQPRTVFAPQASYTIRPSSSSIPQRQPPSSEFYLPRSNSDLLVGTVNSRDPYTMETPLNTALDIPLPPPPPLLSGGRLGAIIVLYVSLHYSVPSPPSPHHLIIPSSLHPSIPPSPVLLIDDVLLRQTNPS